ncbi:SKG1 [Candida margitis]|uniref:SKG1 n=1 Tax=Candida margitis TaxID=1775924 RepID=UPI002226A832|nr:SKG1 [Candida margitis]KAI5955403.1 SKG1 [Candida margitis]
MVNRQSLAVGLAVGVPSFIILMIVFIFWYKNQRQLRKEDLDDDYIDQEIQNDDSSFQQFHEQLHKQYEKGEKVDDGIQLKEHVVALNGPSDSSNGSLESDLNQPQEPEHPQPVLTRPSSKHPYGQHLKYMPSSSTAAAPPPQQQHQQNHHQQGSQSSLSLSQTSDEFSNAYDRSPDEFQSVPRKTNTRAVPPPPPPQRQASNKTSVYAFYDTFIPTFNTQEPSSSQQQQQNLSSSHPNSTHNSFSDLLNQTAHSSLNILKSNNHNQNTNNNNSNQHKHTNSSSDSNTSLLHNHSTPHSRAPSTDLDTLAKQLNNPVFFEKLPSKAAAAQGKVFIKPRVPSNNAHNNSSSELINNYLVGENTAINDHFTYEAPMVETANSTDNLAQVGGSGAGKSSQVMTYNQHLATAAANSGALRPSQDRTEELQKQQEANPLNGQIGNAFDANISMEPLAMNKKNTTTNKDEDVMPPVVFQ